MDFLELSHWRYATKKYDHNKSINPESVRALKEILRMSPSSINCQPWQFYFIENEAAKNSLAEVSKHNTQKIRDAKLLIVFGVVNDLDTYDEILQSPSMTDKTRDAYNDARPFMSELTIKEWMARQVYISLGFCLSACASMGLDSTPMEGIEQDAYHQQLNMGSFWPLFAVAVGHRAEDDFNQPSENPKSRRPLSDVVVTIK